MGESPTSFISFLRSLKASAYSASAVDKEKIISYDLSRFPITCGFPFADVHRKRAGVRESLQGAGDLFRKDHQTLPRRQSLRGSPASVSHCSFTP